MILNKRDTLLFFIKLLKIDFFIFKKLLLINTKYIIYNSIY